MKSENTTWLPNLVGGVSIWKLGVDLNEPKFFDGRLLVPKTEGSDSLPVSVEWDTAGLVPLREAEQRWPAEAAQATADFQACLAKVAAVFATPNSGYDKYKEAFTMPTADADGGAHYFYDPERQRVLVQNWGASPRSMASGGPSAYGYEEWNETFGKPAASSSTVAVPLAGAVAATAAAAETPKKEEPKREPAKKAAGAWWIWPLLALVAIMLALLALLLFRACSNDETTSPADDAAVTTATDGEGPKDSPVALLDASRGEDGAIVEEVIRLEDGAVVVVTDPTKFIVDVSSSSSSGGGPNSSSGIGSNSSGSGGPDETNGTGEGDGSANGADGGADRDRADAGGEGPGTADGGRDATHGDGDQGADGGRDATHGDGDGQHGKDGGGKPPTSPPDNGAHRLHERDGAVRWRVAVGGNKVAQTKQDGSRFDVWLLPGKTFEGVRVEWQDKAGKWHAH